MGTHWVGVRAQSHPSKRKDNPYHWRLPGVMLERPPVTPATDLLFHVEMTWGPSQGGRDGRSRALHPIHPSRRSTELWEGVSSWLVQGEGEVVRHKKPGGRGG